MTRPLRWPALIIVTMVLLTDLQLTDTHGAVRIALSFWFVLVCPGMAFAPLLSIRSATAELAVGVALSAALGTLAATAMVVVAGLTASTALFALQGICLLGCALQVARWERERRLPVVLDPS
jgi:hypothetical protein